MGEERQIRYVGTSMNPRFLQNDILNWAPAGEQQPVPGDVILFRDPADSDRLIIHRVVGIYPDGTYRTRGDNSRYDDIYPVHRSSIVGVVTGGKRGEWPLGITSGFSGRIHHLYAQQRCRVLPLVQKFFRPPYHLLSRYGQLYNLLPARFRQQLVIVKTYDGCDLQVYLGRHLAGWKGEEDPDWTIRPPWRLFINHSSLPDSPLDCIRES